MGYGEAQMRELAATIRAVPCDSVVIATPIDLTRILELDKPATRVTYDLQEIEPGVIKQAIQSTLEKRRGLVGTR